MVTTPDSALTTPADPSAPTQRRRSAVLLWGLIGAVVLVVIAQAMIRWFASDDFEATADGPDHYDHLTTLRLVEVASVLLLLSLFYGCVVHPWLRRRRFEFDGMLLIGGLLIHFIDPVFNYFSPHFLQNSHSVQWGSWANFIPGYASPSGDAGYVEGVLWAAALYGLFGIAAALGGCWILGKLRARMPRATNFTLYSILFAIFAVLDLIVEIFFVRSEIYIFWGSYSDFTLWSGELYQFPLYETFLATVYALGFVWLRDTRDSRGRSHVEQGADELPIPRQLQTTLRFSAVAGFCLVWGMVSYFMPYNWFAMKADSYPELPSYLEGGAFCGTEGQDRCPAQYLHDLDEGYMKIPRQDGDGTRPPPATTTPRT